MFLSLIRQYCSDACKAYVPYMILKVHVYVNLNFY